MRGKKIQKVCDKPSDLVKAWSERFPLEIKRKLPEGSDRRIDTEERLLNVSELNNL
jgi:hypothetical protein